MYKQVPYIIVPGYQQVYYIIVPGLGGGTMSSNTVFFITIALSDIF